jgi:hypothetical protein
MLNSLSDDATKDRDDLLSTALQQLVDGGWPVDRLGTTWHQHQQTGAVEADGLRVYEVVLTSHDAATVGFRVRSERTSSWMERWLATAVTRVDEGGELMAVVPPPAG